MIRCASARISSQFSGSSVSIGCFSSMAAIEPLFPVLRHAGPYLTDSFSVRLSSRSRYPLRTRIGNEVGRVVGARQKVRECRFKISSNKRYKTGFSGFHAPAYIRTISHLARHGSPLEQCVMEWDQRA